jgi:hypothetical protein
MMLALELAKVASPQKTTIATLFECGPLIARTMSAAQVSAAFVWWICHSCRV